GRLPASRARPCHRRPAPKRSTERGEQASSATPARGAGGRNGFCYPVRGRPASRPACLDRRLDRQARQDVFANARVDTLKVGEAEFVERLARPFAESDGAAGNVMRLAKGHSIGGK